MEKETAQELLQFLAKCPSCFHAVDTMKQELAGAGYTELREGESWQLAEGGNYYVTRNGSSIIAFRVPCKDFTGFHIIASHSDSPTFKIKDNAEIKVDGKFTKLNVEKYGGMLCAPWLDRPLSVAGRLLIRSGDGIRTVLVNVDRDLLLIPNLAIHMNREVNEGYAYNAQVDMLPLFGDENAGSFLELIAGEAGIPVGDILGTDLFLYSRTPASIWGAHGEFLSSGRLDDLQCAFSSLRGFLAARPSRGVPVHCVLDNEEVGSGTKQGAASTFLRDTLTRLNRALGRTEDEYLMALARSFMVSADNAHSVHPNKAEKADPTNRTYLNGGIVIKYSANQKYTTDAVSAALFKTVCERANVPYQSFTNRSDMLGGSTLGNLSNTQVALNTVDIGLPQLAMHSPYETAGIKDTQYLVDAAAEFFGSCITSDGDGMYRLEK